MGANDAAEMLEVAKEEYGKLERAYAELATERDDAEQRETATVGRFSEARRRALKAEAKLAEQQAVFDAMRAIVSDPVSDYYGEIRVKFDALSTSGTEALEARDAEKWDEGYTVGNRHDGRRDANPYRKTPETGEAP